MLKHHSTYEIMRPEDVGLSRTHLVLGKHSGRAALRERIKELGFELGDAELARVFEDFKALADKKKELFDGDLEALVLRAEFGTSGPWHLESLHAQSDSGGVASARVGLRHSDGRLLSQESTGDGPVDAAFKAIETATDVFVKLRKFEVRSVSMGEDAQGEAIVTVEHNGRAYRGASVTTDIVESGVRAFLEVVNQIESSRANATRAGVERRATEAAADAATI
jgi:2-isopropylmalate synthase